MTSVGNILHHLLNWAPAALAWEKDNIGLLLGSASHEVSRVLVCLDVTPEIVEEAVQSEAQLIVAHHPIIFHALKRIRTDTANGRLLARLLRHDIAVIAMHTNADATSNGVNHALADALGLQECKVLNTVHGRMRRIELRCTHGHDLLQRLHDVLQYSEELQWTSRNVDDSIVIVEITCPSWRSADVLASIHRLLGAAVLSSTVLATEQVAPGYGLGLLGELETELTPSRFIDRVKTALDCDMVRAGRFSDDMSLKRIAVCGGAGNSVIPAAIDAGAQCLVTGDLTHHTFLEFREELLLIDAGHFETERPFIQRCVDILQSIPFHDMQKIDILKTRTNTNPLWFV